MQLPASALLFSLLRVAKGPITNILTVTAAGAGVYDGKTLYAIRNYVRS